jgi:hypothetical protein
MALTELIHWSHDYGGSLQQAEQSKKPLLLDFTAAPM